MAFIATFTIFTVIIIVTVTVTRLHTTNTLNFAQSDNVNGSQNVSIPGKYQRYQMEGGRGLTVQKGVQSVVRERQDMDWDFKHVQKESNQPTSLDLMDCSSPQAQNESLSVDTAILLRKSNRVRCVPDLEPLTSWQKVFSHLPFLISTCIISICTYITVYHMMSWKILK